MTSQPRCQIYLAFLTFSVYRNLFIKLLSRISHRTKMVILAPKIKLNNGQEMPVLGLGTFLSRGNDCENAVKYGIDYGYRHIDTAYVYENEDLVGRAINAKISAGVVKREDLFIVTKLAGIHHAPEMVEHACRKSLEKLGLNYIDLYLIHFPVGSVYINDKVLSPIDKSGRLLFSDVDYVDTWKGMEKLVELGLTRSIGVSNFNSEQIERILKSCKIKPVTNQVECHPELNQKKLIEFCKQRDIVITAYSPLARPSSHHRPEFFYDEKLKTMTEKYNKTPAQLILRYLLDNVPIPKSVTKERIAENINVFDFKLDDEDMKVMDSYNKNRRICTFEMMKKHKYFPFNAEF